MVWDGCRGETLVYDPTDAVGIVRDGPGEDFNVTTRHLIGHWHVEEQSSR